MSPTCADCKVRHVALGLQRVFANPKTFPGMRQSDRLTFLLRPKQLRLDNFRLAEVDEAIKLYCAGLDSLGLRVCPGLADEIAHVTSAVEVNPGPLLAYCKGDQNAAADYIRCAGQPRLFDFGAGGLRQALIEGMPGRITWGCMMRVPQRVVSSMEKAYQLRLAEGYAQPQMIACSIGVWRRQARDGTSFTSCIACLTHSKPIGKEGPQPCASRRSPR